MLTINGGTVRIELTQQAYKLLLMQVVEPYEEHQVEMVGKTPLEHMKYAYRIMCDESGLNADPDGFDKEYEYCRAWLMGLPAVLPLPYMNSEIMEWAEKMLGIELTRMQGHEIIAEYWGELATALINLGTE